MQYVIHPLKGVNDVEFGMHVSEVRRRMGGDPEQFRRGGEGYPSDYHVKEGVFCYYDDQGFLEAIEFANIAPAFLDGVDLFTLSVSEMAALLTRLDPEGGRDHDGASSRRLCLAAWAPDDDDEGDDAPVESMLTGRPGYCDYLDPVVR